MATIRVGVLRGGMSPEYEVSLRSGGNVLKHLPNDMKGRDVLITKDGAWHLGGIPMSPARVADQVDVFFNALHGAYGEDGKIQRTLDALGVPYTGSRALPSSIAMAKHLSKRYYDRYGIKTPIAKVVRNVGVIEEKAKEIFETMSPPWIVKPAGAGSSFGVRIARSYRELVEAFLQAFAYGDVALVEEFIKGKEATCCVVEHHNGSLSALPPIEIRPPVGASFFDYEVKYNGQTREICPGDFTSEEAEKIMEMAEDAHFALGLSHYSRSDFIVSPSRGIYILETNNLPGLTDESLIMKALKAVGINFTEFLEHVIHLARRKK